MSDATAPNAGGSPTKLPRALTLTLTVRDPDVVFELNSMENDDQRETYALQALRIGVLALRQARGQIDSEAIRQEAELMLADLRQALDQHREQVNEGVSFALREYFDPNDGRFTDRLRRLIEKDGELEKVLRAQIDGEGSTLARTLTAHVGENSPLFKMLSPTESEGLLAQLTEVVEKELDGQRDRILKEFTLDEEGSALSRLVQEVTRKNGLLAEDLTERIDEVVGEFSLDDEESALSRLVKRVETAQESITREFSLDDEESALARMQERLMKTLADESQKNQAFREEVKIALSELKARREAEAAGTRHGLDFEDEVVEFLKKEAQLGGDLAWASGNTTGAIKHCKKGDCVVRLGPEKSAAGAQIVVEAKEDRTYDLKKALAEVAEARKNREAEIGLFVFSKKTAPASLPSLVRYGNDIVTVWDSEDTTSDLYLSTALTLASALCTRGVLERAASDVDFGELEKAMLEVEKRSNGLEEIETWVGTIKSNSDKILQRVGVTRRALEQQVEVLRDRITDVQDALGARES